MSPQQNNIQQTQNLKLNLPLKYLKNKIPVINNGL